MHSNSYLTQLTSKPQIAEQLGFEEWLELAQVRGIPPLVVAFSKTAIDLLTPNATGQTVMTLNQLTSLGKDLKALGNRPDRSLFGMHNPDDKAVAQQNSVKSLASARLAPVAAARFMELFTCNIRVYEYIRNALNGKLVNTPDDFKDALVNYNETQAICKQEVLADLYSEKQLLEARVQFMEVECYLAHVVPAFISAIGRLPSHPKVIAQVEKYEELERIRKLREFGIGMMERFIEAIQLLPENVVTAQVQSFRDHVFLPSSWDNFKDFTLSKAPPNMGMLMLEMAMVNLNTPSVFFEHLSSAVEAAVVNPGSDLDSLML